MADFESIKLRDVCSFQEGYVNPSQKHPEYFDGNIKWIRVNDLNNSYVYDTSRKLSVIGFKSAGKSALLFEPNTIVISKSGTIGKLGIIKDFMCGNRAVINIKVNESKANHKFIFYYLRSIQNEIETMAVGSVQPNLYTSILGDIPLSLPSLLTQTGISEALSSLDDKIDLLNQQNRTLEALAETLFRQWFVEEADDSWEEVKLANFIAPRKGKNITKEEAIYGEYPVVAGGLNPSCYHNQSNTSSPVITISASGANAGFVRLYFTKIWSSDSTFIDDTITPYIYFFYVFLKVKQTELYDKQEGSAQPHIYPSHIMDLNILNYPMENIKKYDEYIKPSFLKIAYNFNQIQQLESLRDILLPKLMSGAVRVN